MFWKIMKVASVILLSCLSCSYIKKLFYSPEKNKSQFIRDKDCRIAIYHGVNVSNYSKASVGNLPWQAKEDFARLKDWGFNLVRYLIFWSAVEPTKGNYDAQYIQNTVERLKWLQDLGIDVIVDVHQDLFNKKYTGNGFPDWTVNDGGIPFTPRQPWNMNYFEPALIASYNNFWKSEELKSSYIAMVKYVLTNVDSMSNVIGIDVMNEPFLGTIPNFEKITLTDFYNKIQDMMIEGNFKSEMFFEPMMYTSGGIPTNLKFVPKRDCSYYPHYYDAFCHEGKAYSKLNKAILIRSIAIKEKEAQLFDTPLLFGEFGISSAVGNYLDYLRDFVDINNAGLNGWTYFTYDKTSSDDFGIVNDDGTETERMKVLVCLYPQRIAGDNPVVDYGTDYFTLKYDSKPADCVSGVTEIFIPPKKIGVNINGISIPDHPGSWVYKYTNQNAATQSIKITWSNP
jgi:endoglycosylceramidase